jgi:phosphoribosyl 1,2-cyclic phosphodiesterase
MEFAILATGSRGNALAVRNGDGVLLVDAGLSGKEIVRRLAHFGVRTEDVRGLLVSHGHGDHVRGARVLARRFGWLVVGTAETLARIGPDESKAAPVREIRPGDRFRIAGFAVRAYPTPHDVSGSVQYVIRSGGRSLTLATDIGEVTPAVRRAIGGVGAVLLEANHDPDMLRTGPYPVFLKRRIAGPEGHLSNTAAAALLARLGDRIPPLVVLGHMSETNNEPEVARRTVQDVLEDSGVRPERLEIVPQGVMGGWYPVPESSENERDA